MNIYRNLEEQADARSWERMKKLFPQNQVKSKPKQQECKKVTSQELQQQL